MKLALCNEMYGNKAVGEVAARAKVFGYNALEVAPFTLGADPLSADAKAIRASVEKEGLKISGLHWLLAKTQGLHAAHPEKTIRERTIAHLTGLADLCAALGGKILVFGSPAQRSIPEKATREDTIKRLTDTFAAVGRECAKRNLTLTIEPLTKKETDAINTAEEAVEIITAINNPNVMLHLDVKAMSAEAKPIPEIIAENAKWLRSFHSNDANMLGPGMGNIDHKPIIAALNEAGYKGYLSVGVFDFTPGPDTIARKSADYLKTLLKERR